LHPSSWLWPSCTYYILLVQYQRHAIIVSIQFWLSFNTYTGRPKFFRFLFFHPEVDGWMDGKWQFPAPWTTKIHINVCNITWCSNQRAQMALVFFWIGSTFQRVVGVIIRHGTALHDVDYGHLLGLLFRFSYTFSFLRTIIIQSAW
jgi:hypothetical protein